MGLIRFKCSLMGSFSSSTGLLRSPGHASPEEFLQLNESFKGFESLIQPFWNLHFMAFTV